MNDNPTSPLTIDRSNGLLELTLNRPDSANALDAALVEALIEAITTADDTRLCVIRGAGRHFCAGFDLSHLEDSSDGDLLWRLLRIETLLQAVHYAPFAVVAMAQGQIIGAGADLFGACWRRVATGDARLRMPGWNFELGLGTRRLARLIGQDAARDLLIDSKAVAAEQGLACGLMTDICEQEQWPEMIGDLQQRCSRLSPTALAGMLQLTSVDSRNDDIAAIVHTAGRPGLKQRIIAYRERASVVSR